MLGICPNCKIKLNEPPFNNRKTNEVMLVLDYRRYKDSKTPIKPIEETGYCEICNATLHDIKEQNIGTK